VALVAELAAVSGLEPGDVVHEIGAGAGQLTGALLECGFNVTANEPGANMRRRLAQLDDRRLAVRAGRFEADPVERHSAAAVFAANSFHWIEPEVAFPKVAEPSPQGWRNPQVRLDSLPRKRV
jgi:hypothetical protein